MDNYNKEFKENIILYGLNKSCATLLCIVF